MGRLLKKENELPDQMTLCPIDRLDTRPQFHDWISLYRLFFHEYEDFFFLVWLNIKPLIRNQYNIAGQDLGQIKPFTFLQEAHLARNIRHPISIYKLLNVFWVSISKSSSVTCIYAHLLLYPVILSLCPSCINYTILMS